MTTMRDRVKEALPRPLLHGLVVARGWLHWLRVQAPVARVLGPQYRRSRTFVEIDVTWACNLRCYNCNRSCEQAPTSDRVTLAQIQQFVDDSAARGVRWRRIRILGGEPTLHPDLAEILGVLRNWRDLHSPETLIELVTNGHGARVREVLASLPPDVVVVNTQKASQAQPFLPFNVAPQDLRAYQHADFRSGCGVTQYCGLGLTPRGWYPCAVAGGIDRVLRHDLGRATFPDPSDDLFPELASFCRVCGLFERRFRSPVTEPVMSWTWSDAYGAHERRADERRAERRGVPVGTSFRVPASPADRPG